MPLDGITDFMLSMEFSWLHPHISGEIPLAEDRSWSKVPNPWNKFFARSDCCGKFLIYKMYTVDRSILKSSSRKKAFLQNEWLS